MEPFPWCSKIRGDCTKVAYNEQGLAKNGYSLLVSLDKDMKMNSDIQLNELGQPIFCQTQCYAPFILDACCGGRMFWYVKEDANVLFMDRREVDKGAFPNNWNPNWCVKPDLIADFREMPFADNTFKMVVFDPPHLTSGSEKGVINKKYGLLNKQTWKHDIVTGFKECYRVLDNYGTLIFKWNEANIRASELLKEFPVKPLFGDFTGKTGKTVWMTFMKLPTNGA